MSISKSNVKNNNNNNNNSISTPATFPASHASHYDECTHDPRLTPDGLEHVCVKCGAVLSPDAAEGNAAVAIQTQRQQTTKSKVNLYVNHQLGSVEAATTNAKMQEMLSLSDSRSLKIAKNGSDHASASRYLSAFSNACDRLAMSPVDAECAWQVFCKVYRQLCMTKPRVISAAEAALYSICCYCSTVDEYEAASAVSSAFGTRHTRMRDLYHLRIMVSTRVEGLPMQPGDGMRYTASAMWMHGIIARRFLSSSDGALPGQRQSVLSAHAARTGIALGKMEKNTGGR